MYSQSCSSKRIRQHLHSIKVGLFLEGSISMVTTV
uniref:Uncharacterized protein n=1 Tax=Rhizophora mucronata TaxID=61149 RepID=A0A2P2P3U1_RHIMU